MDFDAPVLYPAGRDAHDRLDTLVWRLPEPMSALSSASVGGGLSSIGWVVNAQVARDYARMDLEEHAAELAAEHGLRGAGATLLTAARVHRWTSASEPGVRADVTVGVNNPTWAADADGAWTPWRRPGTINIVARFDAVLSVAAMVGAVITITEAKTQALVEAGVPGTGTATDTVVVLARLVGSGNDPESFCGPRSRLGSRIARCVHSAVLERITSDAPSSP